MTDEFIALRIMAEIKYPEEWEIEEGECGIYDSYVRYLIKESRYETNCYIKAIIENISGAYVIEITPYFDSETVGETRREVQLSEVYTSVTAGMYNRYLHHRT